MKVKLEIEVDIEDMDSGEMAWFKENILTKDLILHSNEIGDTVGEITAVRVLKQKSVKRKYGLD